MAPHGALILRCSSHVRHFSVSNRETISWRSLSNTPRLVCPSFERGLRHLCGLATFSHPPD